MLRTSIIAGAATLAALVPLEAWPNPAAVAQKAIAINGIMEPRCAGSHDTIVDLTVPPQTSISRSVNRKPSRDADLTRRSMPLRRGVRVVSDNRSAISVFWQLVNDNLDPTIVRVVSRNLQNVPSGERPTKPGECELSFSLDGESVTNIDLEADNSAEVSLAKPSTIATNYGDLTSTKAFVVQSGYEGVTHLRLLVEQAGSLAARIIDFDQLVQTPNGWLLLRYSSGYLIIVLLFGSMTAAMVVPFQNEIRSSRKIVKKR